MFSALIALIGCGKNNETEFRGAVEKAMIELRMKTASHQSVWGFGQAKRWDLNQDQGTLIFTFSDKTVSCEAQIIGSYDKVKGTWLWSWDNPSVASNMVHSSNQLKEYGKLHGFTKLTRAEWKATEDEAWEVAALAMSVLKAQGVYRGPAGDTLVFFSFGAPQIQKMTAPAGVPEPKGQSDGK
jgi:hypothetical protein